MGSSVSSMWLFRGISLFVGYTQKRYFCLYTYCFFILANFIDIGKIKERESLISFIGIGKQRVTHVPS